MRRLRPVSTRDDSGFSTVEMLVAAGISLALLTGLAITLLSGFRTSSFGANQSISLDGARQTLNQVARDLQGSKQFENCVQPGEPEGSCILVLVQSPAGGDHLVRYRLEGARLFRELDDGTGTFPSSAVITDRLANLVRSPQRPLFVCSNVGSLLQVSVDMLVQPNPLNTPAYQLQTIVRPRNTYLPPSC